jgi:TetR/AcrR family transcriptional regulator, cholesterol catabolism regulator
VAEPLSKRELRKERAKEEILEAAAAAIAHQGFHGMSMRRLASETDRSLANFYNHFSSKEEVLLALHRRAFETLITHAENVVAKADHPSGQLYVFIDSHVRYFLAHPEIMRVLVHEFSGLGPEQRAEVKQLKERYFQVARAIVAKLMCDGCAHAPIEPRDADCDEVNRTAYCVFGMLNWVFAWYDSGAHGTPDDVVRTIYRTALCGLTAACPGVELSTEVSRVVNEIKLPSLLRPTEKRPS